MRRKKLLVWIGSWAPDEVPEGEEVPIESNGNDMYIKITNEPSNENGNEDCDLMTEPFFFYSFRFFVPVGV